MKIGKYWINLLILVILSPTFFLNFNFNNTHNLDENLIYLNTQSKSTKFNFPHIFSTSSWENNGTLISNASNNQRYPQLCSDGNGGAIITWTDARNDGGDIYAQKIDSNGVIQWSLNGNLISNATNSQIDPQICSDGSGGAIITWRDQRDDGGDIYAQKINSNGGIEWTTNGVAICTASGTQQIPQTCSDGNDGAIIMWWDSRDDAGDIYAQRINTNGIINWSINGIAICQKTGEQRYPEICSDGNNGAIIVWNGDTSSNWDNYAQRVNSSGHTKWQNNGIPICNTGEHQNIPHISSDGEDGALIAWADWRNGNRDIYAQKVNLTGHTKWIANGTMVCNATNNQGYPDICNDGLGGAIITWQDYRNSNIRDIYAQRIDSSGFTSWQDNGTPICLANNHQIEPIISSDGNNGAFITWRDLRVDGSGDIYAQHINSTGHIFFNQNGTTICNKSNTQSSPQLSNNKIANVIITWQDARVSNYDIYAYSLTTDQIPTSNHPNNISTTKFGTENITWTLSDDIGSGKYRVWTNDSNDNYYIRQDWTSWINNVAFDITINRTAPGIYNYTIEYNDSSDQFGISDTVFVEINDTIPSSNQPENVITNAGGSENLTWILYDEYGPGKYRVWTNDTNNVYYILKDWDSWYNNTPIQISINRTAPGVFNYTIEYNDSNNNFGNPNTVNVTILNNAPTSTHMIPPLVLQYMPNTFGWILYDDFGPGEYRIWGTYEGTSYILVDWTPWENNTVIEFTYMLPHQTCYNFTLEFYDNHSQYGIIDTILVTPLPFSTFLITISTFSSGGVFIFDNPNFLFLLLIFGIVGFVTTLLTANSINRKTSIEKEKGKIKGKIKGKKIRKDQLISDLKSKFNLVDDNIVRDEKDQIISLDFSNKNLTKIPNFANINTLINLDLSNNSISEISGLQKLSGLVKLNLSNNNIKKIKGLENLSKLEELNLANNKITEIMPIRGPQSLKFLDLSGNKIKDIKNVLKFSDLTQIDLSRNQVEG